MTVLRRILWMLGWGSASVLIAAFLLGYAAPYLPPSRFWWTDLFAVFLPPLSLAVGLLGLALLAQGVYRRRWGRVVVAGGLLLLVTARFGPRLGVGGPVSTSVPELRLMTFNLPPSFARRSALETTFSEMVRREAPDILAVQESPIRTGPRGQAPPLRISTSIQLLLDGAMGYTLPRVLPLKIQIQQPVLGRLPLDSMSVHPLPPSGASSARSRYTRTQFTWQGRPVALYNLHLHSVGDARPWQAVPKTWMSLSRWRTFLQTYREGALRRAQQARLIRREIEREDRPVLVVGDFNSTPHQWAYRHIAQGLESAVMRRGRGWNATFPAQRPLVQIDHVLVGPAWDVTAARVPPLSGPHAISDHRPVVAQLRWANE